ncbi:DEAD/DEAH box helicase [Canibacter zhuwentaonis]|uniref:DEAD/DEAH box helicase n=1 Tax=Canibacter zhuwentaonis TaxID=2837491 RepID=UPI002027AF00|nr:DEAD/DEAH box helicase [Canibacter zhuwentaonis]
MSETPALAQIAAELLRENTPDAAYDEFTSWVQQHRGFQLYPAQAEALTAVMLDANVVLATPTGTGKSTVALGAHFYALAQGKRSVYTAPIKALVSEKFFELAEVFGAANVGMLTGDVTINPQAPVLCATAEIIAQFALSDPACCGIDQIIMDEFHYYADKQRGWAWQVPLLTAHHAQFVLMSATLGDVTPVVATLNQNTGRETAEITGVDRPVPLSYSYELETVQKTVELALKSSRAPLYLVHFKQADAIEQANALMSLAPLEKHEKSALSKALQDAKFNSGYGPTLKKLLQNGIGVHHAGLLPKYRRLVEQLAQQGLLKIISGTDTLGVGINVPIRSVILTTLIKFDGTKERRLSAREYHQIGGRAGRAGHDTAGDVIVVAPEHEVANALAASKAAAKEAQNNRNVTREHAA